MAKELKNNYNGVTVKKGKDVDIRRTIKAETQLYRITTDLAKYRTAVIWAENLTSPQRYNLYQLYQQSVLDAHLTACIQQRKNLILSKEFIVCGADGKENEEKTALINKKWFRDYLDLALDSLYWGHSLIQFDDIIEQEFKCVDLVPRIYVKPEFHIVTESYSDITGTDYLELPFKNWVIGVGKPKDLGLLLKATPLVIWKKNALGAWAEFVEKFGSPLRIGKTNVRDELSRSNMENMLKNMGVASYGVFDTDDLIELIESKRQDAYQVFDMMINRCNSEISKLILGQTATMDEKSFVGSAEVHERVLKMVEFQDEFFIKGVNNYQLAPLLIDKGILAVGDTIEVANEDELSLEQKGKFDIELLKTGKFTFTPEYIKEKYGTEVIEVKAEESNLNEVKNRLAEYYS